MKADIHPELHQDDDHLYRVSDGLPGAHHAHGYQGRDLRVLSSVLHGSAEVC